MRYLSLFVEIILIAVGFLFVWTQLVYPAMKGTLMFPLFRTDRRKAEAAAQEFQEKKEVDEIKQSIEPPEQPQSTSSTKHSKRGGSK
jgi:hypothetical protein